MHRNLIALITVGSAALLFQTGAAASSTARTVVLAATGDAGPGGDGVHASLSAPVLGDSGEVAFMGGLTGTADGVYPHAGLFRGNEGSGVSLVARSGQESVDGNGSYSYFTNLAINGSGDVLFGARLRGTEGGQSDDHALLLASGGSITQLVRKGQTAPDGDGAFDGIIAHALNDAGQVALTAIGTSDGASDHGGIWIASGEQVTKVFERGDVTPDGEFFVYPTHPYLNDLGQAVFQAHLSETIDGGAGERGLFVSSGGELITIVRRGQPAPDGNGTFYSLAAAGINNSGQITFDANFLDAANTIESEGIFRSTLSGEITTILRGGDLNPDGDAVIWGSQTLGTNEAGDVLAWINFFVETPNGSELKSAFVIGSGGPLKQILRTDQAAPDGNGFFAGAAYATMNDAGQVAFRAAYRDTSGGQSDDEAIYVYDERLGMLAVARKGDSLRGDTITELSMNEATGGGQYAGANEFTGFNAAGQVAYRYVLANGESGVALWTPPSLNDILPGDASLDGTVSLADFLILRGNFGSDDGYFTTGDFNGDKLVSLADFLILRANFGNASDGDAAAMDAWLATVPEPAAASALALVGLLLRRRR